MRPPLLRMPGIRGRALRPGRAVAQVDGKPFRILVTGSRDWTDKDQVRDAILGWARHARPKGRPIVIVHGDCPTGADKIASDFVNLTLTAWMDGFSEEAHPANWVALGNPAGMLRNLEMVCLGADVCLAFLGPCTARGCRRLQPHHSHGASHCADKAEAEGIPVMRFYAPGNRPADECVLVA